MLTSVTPGEDSGRRKYMVYSCSWPAHTFYTLGLLRVDYYSVAVKSF